jgi:hypothetical protein
MSQSKIKEISKLSIFKLFLGKVSIKPDTQKINVLLKSVKTREKTKETNTTVSGYDEIVLNC